MSGGIAYVYDPDGAFPSLVNYEMVDLEHVAGEDEEWLRTTIARHGEFTESAVAEQLLGAWTVEVARFRKVMPRDYKKVLAVMAAAKAAGLDDAETANKVMEASRG
jgi:glutamate synthase (NADPH/NADH) large chain